MAQAVVNDIDGRYICWNRTDKPAAPRDADAAMVDADAIEDELLNEHTVDWFFATVETATKAMDRLNDLLIKQQERLH